jgi:glycosyltransferase involved in cell wall biosynthesis
LRGQLIRDAAAVIVGTEAAARGARRLLHVRRDRIRIVPLAPRTPFRPGPSDDIANGDGKSNTDAEADADKLRRDLGAGDRYLVYPGRYDARHDVRSLFEALAIVAARSRPAGLPADVSWPVRVLVVGATPDDRAALARAAAGQGVGALLAYVPAVSPAVTAALVRHARAVILPVISDAAGLAAIESIASGTPVVASAVGALSEVVGAAGLLVEPRDAEHLAVALTAISADDVVYRRVADVAILRATGSRRTWADVAAETRAIYAEVGIKRAQRRGA